MDNVELLKKYKELLDNGIITQEEFDEKKKALLEQLESVEEGKHTNISEPFNTIEDQTNVDIVENIEQDFNEFDQEEQTRRFGQQDVTNPSDEDHVQNISERSIVESGAIAEAVVQKPKKLKLSIIIVAAAVVLAIIIGIAVLGGAPKATSIEASYDGYSDSGTVIDSSSPFKVTATLEDGSTQEVTDWTVEETTLHCGFNIIDVNYQDVQTTVSIYSPLVENGQYIASVDEINDTIDHYATKNIDGYTGLSKDPETGGVYNFDGVGFESSVSYTKKSGNENVAVEGSDIPDTVIYSSILGSDEIETYTEEMLESAANVFMAVDPEASEQEAREQIGDITDKTMKNVDSSGLGDSTTTLDNLKVMNSMLFMDAATMVIYSFQEK